MNGAVALAGQTATAAGQPPPSGGGSSKGHATATHNYMHDVSMSLHLMGPTATTELKDVRRVDEHGTREGDPLGAFSAAMLASPALQNPVLAPGQCVDTVVCAMLGELGTHTLRVTIQYWQAHAPAPAPAPLRETVPNSINGGSAATGETKIMRKFYKFSVLAPLKISTVVRFFSGNNGLAIQVCVRLRASFCTILSYFACFSPLSSLCAVPLSIVYLRSVSSAVS